jgi:hypothetical protein
LFLPGFVGHLDRDRFAVVDELFRIDPVPVVPDVHRVLEEFKGHPFGQLPDDVGGVS